MKLFDIVDAISYTKKEVWPEAEDDYQPFMINRALSYYPDSILYANEVNRRPDMPKEHQYRYLINTIRSRKRFAKWAKKTQNEMVELIMTTLQMSRRKAEVAVRALTPEQLRTIAEGTDTGGG